MWLNQWTMFVMKKFGIVSWVLIFLFFLNRVKRNLKDDLDIFLYLKFRFYLFVFFNPFLHSVFLHFYFSKKKCDHKKSTEHYCEFCSWIYPQLFDSYVAFQDIIIDDRDCTLGFNKFSEKTSLFFFDIRLNHAFFIDAKKLRFSNVHILIS